MNRKQRRYLNQSIMIALADGWPHDLADIADQAGADPGDVQTSLNQLVRAGFVHHNLHDREYSKKKN